MTQITREQTMRNLQAFFESPGMYEQLTNDTIRKHNAAGLNLPLKPEPEPQGTTPQTYTSYTDTDEKWDAQSLITEALNKIGRLGGRSNAGIWLSCQFRDEGYTRSETESYLTEYQSRVPDPASYELYEAMSSVDQAYKRAPREKRKRRKINTETGYAYGFSGDGTYTPETLPVDQVTGIYLAFPQSDEGNAECLFHAFPNRYLYCDAYGWMAYTGTHWETKNAEDRLERDINSMLRVREQVIREKGDNPSGKVMGNAANVRGAKFHYKSMVKVSIEDFDNNPETINCLSGVVDLINGDFSEHDPSQRFSYCINRNFDPYVDFTGWEKWLGETVKGGQEMAEYLQMAVGYILTGYTREEILFYIYGPPRSGKGTFTETLLAMMGSPLAKEVDFKTFAEQRGGDNQNFDLAPLKATRFVAASESGKYQQLNAPRVKAITGGNEVWCAFKGKDFFNYIPQYTIILSSNNKPSADVDDDAIWSRLRVIEFPTSHVGKENKHLKQKMKTSANLDAVFSWAVWGAVRWFMSEDGLSLPDVVRDATNESRDSVDYVQQFLDEFANQFEKVLPEDADAITIAKYNQEKADFIKRQESAYITNPDLYFEYQKWCNENGITAKFQRSLSLSLSAKGYTTGHQMRVNGKKYRCVLGITSAVKPTFIDD